MTRRRRCCEYESAIAAIVVDRPGRPVGRSVGRPSPPAASASYLFDVVLALDHRVREQLHLDLLLGGHGFAATADATPSKHHRCCPGHRGITTASGTPGHRHRHRHHEARRFTCRRRARAPQYWWRPGPWLGDNGDRSAVPAGGGGGGGAGNVFGETASGGRWSAARDTVGARVRAVPDGGGRARGRDNVSGITRV